MKITIWNGLITFISWRFVRKTIALISHCKKERKMINRLKRKIWVLIEHLHIINQHIHSYKFIHLAVESPPLLLFFVMFLFSINCFVHVWRSRRKDTKSQKTIVRCVPYSWLKLIGEWKRRKMIFLVFFFAVLF